MRSALSQCWKQSGKSFSSFSLSVWFISCPVDSSGKTQGMRHQKGVVIKGIEVVHEVSCKQTWSEYFLRLGCLLRVRVLKHVKVRLFFLCKAESHQQVRPRLSTHLKKSVATCSATIHFTVPIIPSTSLSNSSSFLLVGRHTFHS